MVLLAGLGCQALVDVSQYRFDDDGGVDTSEPSQPESDELAEPADDAADPPAPASPPQDAGDGRVPGSVSEQLPSPVLEPPPVDAGTPPESSGTDQTSPPSSESEPPMEEPEPEPEPVLPPTEPEPETPPADPPPHPEHVCSEVQFCRAFEEIDTTDEERCLQRGCSVDAAAAECREEVLRVCGAVQPPFVLYTLDGERLELQ